MKNILITAGGTGIAWHLCKIAKEYFSQDFVIHICDVNEPELVPASVYSDYVHVVPMSNQTGYMAEIQRIVSEYKIDIIIPLLPEEGRMFASDSEFIIRNGLFTSAPSLSTYNKITDKKSLFYTLKELNIVTPLIYTVPSDIEPTKDYILKPRLGFGSLGIRIVKGEELKNNSTTYFFDDSTIIQEYCKGEDPVEVTVECFNTGELLRIFARQRISVKSGVCVKSRMIKSDVFYDDICKLIRTYDMPIAFNAQYLYSQEKWKLFDLNLRLGAGTPLATSFGFQLTRAFLSELSGRPVDDSFFEVDSDIKTVLRVYQEIVIK